MGRIGSSGRPILYTGARNFHAALGVGVCMIRQLRIQAFVVTMAVAALVVMGPAPAAASCAAPPPIDEHLSTADAVFVGTVHRVANEGRTASVEVHEIWTGPDLPASVVVHGGPDEPGMATSADRHFQAGTQYLFAASARDGRLDDNACTATQPWTDELAGLRPTDAREPMPLVEETAGMVPVEVPAPLLVALLGASAVALIGFLAFRRRA